MDGNEGVFRFPQSSSITRTSPSDCLVSYPRNSFGWVLTLCRGAVGVFYSPYQQGKLLGSVTYLEQSLRKIVWHRQRRKHCIWRVQRKVMYATLEKLSLFWNRVDNISCLNFWDEAWWFLSLWNFGLLLSSLLLLLFPQRFGRYVLRPSLGVCLTREPPRTSNYVFYWIHGVRLFWFR